MAYEHFHNLSGFFVVGINYKKSDALIRGAFAVNENQYKTILENAASFGVTEMFILSTCNRTEIYGIAGDAEKLAGLLCTVTKGDVREFLSVAYIKQKEEAIEHLFNVAAGLDSQILGDYEIVGQLRLAVKFSKENQMIGSFTERLVNDALQAAKKIRTTTLLSGGTVSVSFAAIQFIRNHFSAVGKNILLIGTGKFGSNTCKNLVDHLPGNTITVINRTIEKAKSLADKYKIEFAEWEVLDSYINAADVILVATHASLPVVSANQFTSIKNRVVIDLSIPCNVNADVINCPQLLLVGVDELSKIKDDTLHKRALEIPKAKAIISDLMDQFLQWVEMRKHVPMLKAVKLKLMTLADDNIFDPQICLAVSAVTGKSSEERIQKVINGMAVKMKTDKQRGCHYIQAINDFISPSLVQ